MKLVGTVAVVSGASSGIGEATARALAERGSRVLLLARNGDRLAEIVRDIRSRGGAAHAYAVDLGVPARLADTAARLHAEHGAPDVLVNNAGSGRWLPLLDTSAEEAAAMMALPYLAAFNLTRELLPGMLARRAGTIVNVTSVASQLSWPGAVAYTAARCAMRGFTNALRADLRTSGVAVLLATFGTVETPYWTSNPGSRQRLPAIARLVRVLPKEEAARAIVRGVERDCRSILLPWAFRPLLALHALLPATVARFVTGR
jgi:short-subunit dehydrogenase